ncbi:MAG: DUF4867 family protein [Roseburia sp.]|nr:DUF4867 family protein [Roseburia sp.]
MQIYDVTDERFRVYGRVVKNIDFSSLVEELKKTPVPDGVVYEPKADAFMALPVADQIRRVFYGELPVQIGYCNGHNVLLNAVEYHRCSEVNVAATDAVLIVGRQQDVTENCTYDTAKMEAFLVPAGCAVELYATTLHYAPCHVKEGGFQVAVILQEGTNYPLNEPHDNGEDAILAAKNKWLIGHPEGGLPEGSFIGLYGKNLNITE